jgi:S1-C subfamily serine protease
MGTLKTVFFLVFIPVFFGISSGRSLEDVSKSVVKIFTTYQYPDYRNPWQFKGQHASSGSGCVIEFKGESMILTSAHCVANRRMILVMLNGHSEKVPAEVVHVGHEVDLALVRPKGKFFTKQSKPVKFGSLPKLREKVTVIGFPLGGDQLSITEGVVSRIELHTYTHSERHLLIIQTDAAVNPGNSGGPFLRIDNGKLIGVAFQGARKAQNIGYCIPMEVVQHFLDDVADGKYDGIPFLGIRYENTENPGFQEYLGLGKETGGIRIVEVAYNSSAWNILQTGDVITHIEGKEGKYMPISNDGTTYFAPAKSRIKFSYYIHMKKVGEPLDLKIIRNKKGKDISVKLKPTVNLVPRPQYDVLPRYYIYGGILFTPLTRNLLLTWGRFGPPELKEQLKKLPTEERQEVVIIKKILDHPINRGYDWVSQRIVKTINGTLIARFADVPKAIENHGGDFHEIVLEDDNLIVCNKKETDRVTADILKLYGIEKDRNLE